MKTISERFVNQFMVGTQRLPVIFRQLNRSQLKLSIDTTAKSLLGLAQNVKMLGVTTGLDEYEKRKLTIFNLLNFFQILTVFIVPIAGIFDPRLTPVSGVEMILPSFISLLVLLLNSMKHYTAAKISYFLLYPLATSFIYLGGVNMGIELSFILYGVLAVFFLQDIGQMVFAVAFSMISYFVLTVLWKSYHYELENSHIGFFVFNQVVVIVFIFYALYLVKTENAGYQQRILAKSEALHLKNNEIRKQKIEIIRKSRLVEKQAKELAEINVFKNKLFSIIAHDLKAPMYALRNVFQNIEQQNLPAREIKELIPDIVHDFNTTTALMENILLWAKSQMESGTACPGAVNIRDLATDITQVLHLQAAGKQIRLLNTVKQDAIVWADRDMIHLALRNLVSNAVKFTPPKGKVVIGVTEHENFAEIFIKDSGVGISPEALQRIRQHENFSTKGTTNEPGTGLGLMLCREFIMKNNGILYIESEVGKGSTFSFTLPLHEPEDNRE